MRENGWLEKEFQAARQRVSEWPEWKKVIEAKNHSSEKTLTESNCPGPSSTADEFKA